MEISEMDHGVTLIETMIAVLVALIGVFSIGTLIFEATVTNKNQGTEVTRATIYAQDKIEKLLSLGSASGAANWVACTQAIASQPSACNSSGITDANWTTGLVAGGAAVSTAIVPVCPSSGASVGYVDFLDFNGNQVAGTCASVASVNPAYVRMWQITDLAATGGPAAKQITVGVWSASAVGNTGGARPVVVLTSYISNPN